MSDSPTPGLLDRLKRINRMFLFTVVIPTALAIVYFGLIASDQYISESRFVVRSQKGQTTGSLLGSLMQGASSSGGLSLSGAQGDASTVHDYILSRDALAGLEKTCRSRRCSACAGSIFSIISRA